MIKVQLRIVDTFAIEGRGVIAATDTPLRAIPIAVKVGQPITFLPPDSPAISSFIKGLEFFGPFDPDRKFAFLVGPDITKGQIPPGTVVLLEGEATEALG